MSKWTPAPWKVSGVGAVIGRDGEYIASVQPLMATRYNAALIAEAPAMAELLDDACAALEMGEAETRSFVALQIRALLERINK